MSRAIASSRPRLPLLLGRRRTRAAGAAGRAVLFRYRRALQIRLGRHGRGRRIAVLDLARAAADVRGQAAEAAGDGLRADRIHARRRTAAQARPIGTSYKPGRFARVGSELRDLPRRVVSRDADEPAADRLGHAGESDGPAGLRQFSDRVRRRIRASTTTRSWRRFARRTRTCPGSTRLLYRFVISATKNGILERAQENAWFDTRPPQGVGRVDTFNPYKVLLQLPIDDTVGTVDLPSLWNQRMRQGMSLHWDGNNDSVEERNKSAAIGAGATPDSLDLPSLARIEEWILDFRPPPFPPARIDKALARNRSGYLQAGVRELPCDRRRRTSER